MRKIDDLLRRVEALENKASVLRPTTPKKRNVLTRAVNRMCQIRREIATIDRFIASHIAGRGPS